MLLLHIGVHKSGTSTIQRFLADNAEVLARHGVIYSRTGRANSAHHGLASELRRSSATRKYDGSWAKVIAETLANPDRNVVISSEAFETLRQPLVETLRDKLCGVDVRIICYIRDFVGRWPSSYAERTKSGSNLQDFDSYLIRHASGNDEDGSWLGMLEHWGKAFGWGSVRVRSLDPRSLANGDLVSDFVSAIGLDYELLRPELPASETLVRNASPGWKTIELLREIHAEYGGRRPMGKRSNFELTEARRICWLVTKIGLEIGRSQGLDASRAQYLTRDQYEQAYSRYASFLTALNAKLVDFQIPAPDRIELPERPFLPCAAKVPLEERAEFHRAFLLRLVGRYADEGSKRLTKRGKKIAEQRQADADAEGAQQRAADGDPAEAERTKKGDRLARRAGRRAAAAKRNQPTPLA